MLGIRDIVLGGKRYYPMVQLRAMVQNLPCGQGLPQYRSNLLNALDSRLYLLANRLKIEQAGQTVYSREVQSVG